MATGAFEGTWQLVADCNTHPRAQPPYSTRDGEGSAPSPAKGDVGSGTDCTCGCPSRAVDSGVSTSPDRSRLGGRGRPGGDSGPLLAGPMATAATAAAAAASSEAGPAVGGAAPAGGAAAPADSSAPASAAATSGGTCSRGIDWDPLRLQVPSRVIVGTAGPLAPLPLPDETARAAAAPSAAAACGGAATLLLRLVSRLLLTSSDRRASVQAMATSGTSAGWGPKGGW